MSTAPEHRSREEICSWLKECLAEYVDRPSEDIDPAKPMASYGLDSVSATAMLVDMEKYLGCTLDPNAPWEHPTVEALATHLAGVAATHPVNRPGAV